MSKSRYVILISGLLATSSVWAQNSDSWDFSIAPYLWTVGLQGSLDVAETETDLDISFGDILDDFDVGGSVYFRGMKGKHGFHIDYTYLRLKPDPVLLPAPPFPENASISQKITINILEAAYNYRLPTTGSMDAFLLLGARNTDIEIKLNAANAPINIDVGPSLTDYFIGFSTNTPLGNGPWAFNFTATVGAGDSDNPWTMQALFMRTYSNDNRLALGARVWNLEFDEANGLAGQNTAMDVTFAGLMIGYLFD